MSTWGALAGLAVAIILILRKVSPVYSMILGALVGGLIGDMGLETTVTAMSDGIKDLVPAIVRIITAGVLSGILIRTAVDSIRIAGRATQGVIVMRFKEEGDHVISMALAAGILLIVAGQALRLSRLPKDILSHLTDTGRREL